MSKYTKKWTKIFLKLNEYEFCAILFRDFFEENIVEGSRVERAENILILATDCEFANFPQLWAITLRFLYQLTTSKVVGKTFIYENLNWISFELGSKKSFDFYYWNKALKSSFACDENCNVDWLRNCIMILR